MPSSSTADRIHGALDPPPGVKPNFIDPPNHDANWIALHTICLTLITFLVGMRLSIRWLGTSGLGVDDLFVVLTWMLSVVFSSVMLKTMDYGLGRHLWDVPESDLVPLGEWFFISEIVARAVWMCLKNAFFWTYKRIFGPSNVMKWLCYGGIFVCTSFYIGEMFHNIFICIPVQKYWNPSIPGHCLPNNVGGSVTGIFNVISDVYVLCLPLPFLWKLQMELKPKLRVMALFCVGVFVNITSITRLALTYTTAENPDVSIKVYNLTLWIVLEINVGLMCVCALVFPAFWTRVLRPQWVKLNSLSKRSKLSHSSNDQITMAPQDSECGSKLVQTEGRERSLTTFASSDRGVDSMEYKRETEGHAGY